ncbi:hypothetical protein BC834DRAFT_883403 [Gloeopeniophorella convolvens]|nr:hypothetical protein BC834DRAFT_883403 [Gloeopeniophorella convolvens]
MRREAPFGTTTLMVKPPPPQTPSDIHDSSLSEIDSISDSDWLDISASEDAGSIGIPESDRDDVEDRPPSRRSFSSHSSSRDGDVDIWEGLVEAIGDEALLEEPAEFTHGASPLGQSSFTYADGFAAEERRVEDALNQSMVSTLSTSRASSMSASGTTNHVAGRARDLRLSFPDPLTSSKDELVHASRELCPSPVQFNTTSMSELSDDEALEDVHSQLPSPSLNLPSIDFDIYLYGTPSNRKWSIVESLLEKWGSVTDLTVSERHPQCNRTSTYWLHSKGNPHRLSLGRAVSVTDNTDAQDMSSTEPTLDKQSLAIVFLPTYLSSLPPHTLFLPIIPSMSDEVGGVDEGARQVYMQQWKILNIPNKRQLFPDAIRMLAVDELDNFDASEVAHAFEPLLPLRRKLFRSIKTQVATAPAMTIVAILSIVLGYIVSRCAPLPVPAATLTEKLNPTSVVKPSVNMSMHVTTPFATAMSTAISISSMREISLAIVSTPPSSLSTVPTSMRRSGARIQEPAVSADKPNAAGASGSNGLIASSQSPCSLSVPSPLRSKALSILQQAVEKTVPKPVEVAAPAVTEAKTENIYSLSTRLTSSLSEIFNLKVLGNALQADMKELLDALDELLQVINAQAASAIRITGQIGSHLRRRNQHAQQTARELREKGEHMLASFGELASSSITHARSRARALKDTIAEEAAVMYREHPAGRLVQKMRERQRGQSRKLRHGVRRMTKGRMGF